MKDYKLDSCTWYFSYFIILIFLFFIRLANHFYNKK